MKKIVYSKFNEELRVYETVGDKIYNDLFTADELHKIGKEQSANLEEIMKSNVIYHIEIQDKNGQWMVLGYLQY